MKKLLLQLFFVLSLHQFFCGCSDSEIEMKLRSIKELGDSDPIMAIAQLDSLSSAALSKSKRTVMLHDLLRIRLRDKAYMLPESDEEIIRIVDYFCQQGNNQEQQEAYYYAGSIYRDLNDSPRALEYFLKSAQIGQNGRLDSDSLLLRNAYSNISSLYTQVQDFVQALAYMKKEKELSVALNRRTMKTEIRMGIAFANCDSVAKAIDAFDAAISLADESADNRQKLETIATALYYYSYYNKEERATRCYDLLRNKEETMHCQNGPLALAEFHRMTGDVDSAIYYLDFILHNDQDIMKRYDAVQSLFNLYKWEQKIAEANEYASYFILLNDTLNLKKHQDFVETATNQYEYYRNKEEEHKIKDEKEVYYYGMLVTSMLAIFALLMFVIIFEWYKNKHLRQTLSISNELKAINIQKLQMAEEVAKKEKELNTTKEALSLSVRELIDTQEKLSVVNSKLRESQTDLKQKEELLKEKTMQNEAIIEQLHREEFGTTAENVIQHIKEASKGHRQLNASDWQQLFHTIDRLHPNFKALVIKNIKNITDSQMRFCYLLQIGLTNGEIENLLDVSRGTIWRWRKAYDWASHLSGE